MSREHDRLKQMILVLEDLDGAERKSEEEHLDACVSCRRLRERLLEAEATGRDTDPLPLEDAPLNRLTEIERAQARSSLSAILNPGTRRRARSIRWIAPLAVAAALVLVALAPHLRRDSAIYDLRVGSPLVLRDAADEPAASRHGVSFRLRSAGHPVLVHVDGEGVGRVVYPSPDELPRLRAAGKLILLPPPAGEDMWRSSLAPGRETYILAVFDPDSPPGREGLEALSNLEPGADRGETIRRFYRMLEYAGSAVVRLDAPAAD